MADHQLLNPPPPSTSSLISPPKYSCLNLQAVLSLTEYFNFLENRLAAAKASISTANLPNSVRFCGEYTRGFFPF